MALIEWIAFAFLRSDGVRRLRFAEGLSFTPFAICLVWTCATGVAMFELVTRLLPV